MVESMLSSSTSQAKLDKFQQNQQMQVWYQEALEGVKDSISTFSSTYCTIDGTQSMMKASTYYSYNVTSSSDSTAVELSSSTTALTGDYSVAVTQLAVQANVSSTGISGGTDGYISSSNTATLGSLSFANDLEFDSNGELSFSINGAAFTFTKDTTLQSMINTINYSDAGVTMKYSRITDGFTITADSGGADSCMTIHNISGNAFGSNSAFQIEECYNLKNGQDSIAEINGKTIAKDSNEYTLDGITFKLKAVTNTTTPETITADETVSFSVERDYSSTVNAITKFVQGFNTLLTSLKTQVSSEDYSTDYPPLTEAQKAEMDEDEIEAWNEKAKNGILSGNSDIEKLISTLKKTFYSAVGGTGENLTSIGITTAGYFDDNSGLLIINEEALTAALEKNPEGVVAMFTNGSTSSASSEQGLMYKIKSALNNYNGVVETALETSETKVNKNEIAIEKLEDDLDAMADRYYQKFSVMETALSKLDSQASLISQLFSS
jgi:flagellar hook-associated protein 2